VQGGIAIAELSPVVIPIFVSHLGCGHQCIFCDQRQFSEPVPPDKIPEIVQGFLSGCRNPGERKRLIAFYGGSFTGIEESLFEQYLEAAHELVLDGTIHGVKASTRPDLVTPELMGRCSRAGFVEMEIGAQSMDDAVLAASGRGHSSGDTVRAARLIKNSGMGLIIQIMPGLPGEDRESYRRTVEEVVGLGPDGVRIYPTVVLKGTALERLYQSGGYVPLTLEEAVERTLFGYVSFSRCGCPVLRMGLPPVDAMHVAAGPHHPSFGFLVKARAFRVMARVLLERYGQGVELEVHPSNISELLGYKGDNRKDLGFSFSFNDYLPRGYVRAKGAAERGCLQPKDIIEYIL
jgi:histone acetyltransferase (RNA polymerase elongator complex component)